MKNKLQPHWKYNCYWLSWLLYLPDSSSQVGVKLLFSAQHHKSPFSALMRLWNNQLEIRLIFFIGVSICHVLDLMLITKWWFTCCKAVLTQRQGCSSFSLLPFQWGDLGCTKSWEETEPGQLAQSGHRDISYSVASCEIVKTGGVGRGQRVMTASWGLAEHWSVCSEQWHCASLVLCVCVYI